MRHGNLYKRQLTINLSLTQVETKHNIQYPHDSLLHHCFRFSMKRRMRDPSWLNFISAGAPPSVQAEGDAPASFLFSFFFFNQDRTGRMFAVAGAVGMCVNDHVCGAVENDVCGRWESRRLFHRAVNVCFPSVERPFSTFPQRFVPPSLIRVWDYPSKQLFDSGAGVPLNQKSASGYSLAVLATTTLPSFSPLLILQFETKILANVENEANSLLTVKMLCAILKPTD